MDPPALSSLVSFVFCGEECDSEGNNEFLVKFTSFPQVS